MAKCANLLCQNEADMKGFDICLKCYMAGVHRALRRREKRERIAEAEKKLDGQ